MNLNSNTFFWMALTVGGAYLAKKQHVIPKAVAYVGVGYAGLRAINSATGSNILGLNGLGGLRGLRGATVSFQQPSMFNGATIAIEQ